MYFILMQAKKITSAKGLQKSRHWTYWRKDMPKAKLRKKCLIVWKKILKAN